MASRLTTARVSDSQVEGRSAFDPSVALATLIFFTTFAGQAWRNLIGWQGFAVVVAGLFIAGVIVYAPRISRARLTAVPATLALFLVVSAVSVLWSQYPGSSVLGIGAQWMTAIAGILIAITLSRRQLVQSLTSALKWVLGLSFAFEIFVSFVIRAPFLPLTMEGGDVPGSFYWSGNALLHGGPIQGIVGNRNLLAFVALLTIIMVTVRFFEGRGRVLSTLVWLAVSLAAIGLTRSATVVLALIALAVVVGLVLLVRYLPTRWRRFVYPGGVFVILAGLGFAIVHSATLFSLVGRDEDMSGRLEIWSKVISLIRLEPVLGWGWVGYWAPWEFPFRGLVVFDGTMFLQAHNALLDVWLQLGAVGVVIALAMTVVAGVRAWRIAVSPVDRNGFSAPYRAITLLPMLLLVALLVQSLTESRLLIEGNWLLFVICCVVVKSDAPPAGSFRRAARLARVGQLGALPLR